MLADAAIDVACVPSVDGCSEASDSAARLDALSLSAQIHGKQFQLVGAVPTRALEQSRPRQHDDQLARHGSSPLLILQGAGGGLHAASGRVVAASAPPLNTELTSALPRALSRASRRWSTARAAILMRIVGLHKANAMVPSLMAQGVEALSSHL